MKLKYILIFALIIVAIIILFLVINEFLIRNNNVLISTDPAKFGLTNEEVGTPYYLDKGEYIKKENEEFFVKNFGLSNGYTQIFADSNYSVDISKTLSLNETDKTQKFLAYRMGVTISLFDSIDGAARYYSDRVNKSELKSSFPPKDLGDEAMAGYNSPSNNVCYFEKCNQHVYALVFRKNNVVVMINRILAQQTSDDKIVEWGRIIESKIK